MTNLEKYINDVCSKEYVIWIQCNSGHQCKEEVIIKLEEMDFKNCNTISEVDDMLSDIMTTEFYESDLFEWGWY